MQRTEDEGELIDVRLIWIALILGCIIFWVWIIQLLT